jgi:hypothetical protein
MAIYRTALINNFTQIDNEIICSKMPPLAYRIYSYLISKPENWKTKAHDIQKQLGLTAYSVRKGLRWLCSAGFAEYIRMKTGHTVWNIFSNPQVFTPKITSSAFATETVLPVFTPEITSPAFATETALPVFTAEITSPAFATETALPVFTPEITSPAFATETVLPVFTAEITSPALPPRVEFPHVENMHDLTIFETEEIKKQQHEPLPEAQKTVVVFSEDKEDLIYPAQLNKDQKKYTQNKIKTAPVELQQDILFELAYRMTLQTIRNLPGFINTLITAANNGTFTLSGGSGSVKKVNPAFAATQALFDKRATFKKSDEKTYKAGIAAARAAIRGA